VARTIDVDSVLDHGALRGLPLLVVICTTLVLVLDGLDIQVIAFAGPALMAEFGIERKALAPVLAAALIGMSIGSFTLGPAGDRYGRRPIILLSGLLFGVATVLAATSQTLWQLTAWRLVTGIGLGGALPNSAALMAEFAPQRWRSMLIAVTIVGVPIGGMFGAEIAAQIIPAHGWRTMFVIAGTLPIIALVAMQFVLPESPRYLASLTGRRDELAALLNRHAGSQVCSHEDTFTTGLFGIAGHRPGIGALFADLYRRDTAALWIIFGTNLFSVYTFFSWTPVILKSLGLAEATAIRGSLVYNLAGTIGTLLSAWAMLRIGSRRPLIANTLIAIAGLFWLWYVVSSAAGSGVSPGVAALMIGFALAGFGINSTQVGAYTVGAHVYATDVRSTGVGAAAGLGRIGGILGAFSGSALLTAFGGPGFFVSLSLIVAFTLMGVLIVRRHIPPHR
jgi:AAHS family 4-hydroxybenzoate transporter-like MFS transporter